MIGSEAELYTDAMRATAILFLLVPCAIAANQPTFSYTVPANTTVTAMAVDAAGNTYLTGTTTSLTFPATPGALQTQFSGGVCFEIFSPGGPGTAPCKDAFVTKLDPTGNVLFATYLGGNGSQTAGSAISVDAAGNIYVGGATSPSIKGGVPDGTPDGFPVTPGAAFTDPDNAGAFVAKLNPAGNQVIYATFLPLFPAISYRQLAMAIDSAGAAYIASTTQPDPFYPMFPTTPGAFQVSPMQGNEVAGVVAKLNASGSALIYGTYPSGSLWDNPLGIAIDAAGDAFITGYTLSTNFPVTPGAFQTTYPVKNGSAYGYAGFVTKLNPQGTGLVYSTFAGSSYDTNNGSNGPTWEIKVDSQGGAYVLGLAPGSGAILLRLSTDGSSLVYSNLLPTANGLDLDPAGNAFVADDAGIVTRFTPQGQIGGAATYPQQGSATITLPPTETIALASNGSVVVAGSGPGAVYVTSLFIPLTVENAASFAANEIAPGEIVAIRGYGIGPATGVSATGPAFPTELAGVQVFFGGVPAPRLYVQSDQINAQVPWELAGLTSTTVMVSYPGVDSTPTPVLMAPSLPGIFYVNNSNGSQNSASNPARPGDFVAIYCTGSGVTNPFGITGGLWPIATSLATLTLPVTVSIGGMNAIVLYAGSASTLESGYFQINVALPSGPQASSAVNLVVTVGGSSSVAVPIYIR